MADTTIKKYSPDDPLIEDLTEALLHDLTILEYTYPKLSSSKFTFHKHKDPNSKAKVRQKYLDDGVCKVCGKKGSYILISDDKPHMCYRCYQAIRAYRRLKVDVLHLQKKDKLTDAQAKKIVKYMKSYSKKKTFLYGMVGAYLINLAAKK